MPTIHCIIWHHLHPLLTRLVTAQASNLFISIPRHEDPCHIASIPASDDGDGDGDRDGDGVDGILVEEYDDDDEVSSSVCSALCVYYSAWA